MKIAFALGALIACCPVVLVAQSATPTPSGVSTHPTATSNGDVASSPKMPMGATVTPESVAAQKDPAIIGTPAWWSTRSTADGKPLSADPKH